jgi:hypothetical protein
MAPVKIHERMRESENDRAMETERETKIWIKIIKNEINVRDGVRVAILLARAYAPCNIFSPNLNSSKFAKSPSSEGIEPVSEFSNR